MINFAELLWKRESNNSRRARSSSPVAFESLGITSRLAQIPVERVSLEKERRIFSLIEPQSPIADRYRHLRMRLREVRDLTKLQSIAVTSPLPEDGKSTSVLCLANALAEGGKHSVLVLEADLHRSSLAKNLLLRPQPGIAECIEDGLNPLSQVRKIDPMGWYLLQAGRSRGNPTEFLQSDAFGTLMQNLTPHFDWILIDTPPVLPITDALALSRHADATLLVVRAHRTPRKAVDETMKILGRKHVLGILLNCSEDPNGLYSEYYSYRAEK